ncbi:MAG: iron-sulfur cluster assembly protein [Planctomycetaceae bacterium]
MLPTVAAVESLLGEVPDPETGRPLTAMGQVVSVAADAAAIAVTVGLTSHSALLWNATRARIEERIRTAFPQVANA